MSVSDFGCGRHHVAKKPHQCSACHRAIPTGVEYYKSFGVTDGDTYTFKAHNDCAAAWGDFAHEVFLADGDDEVSAEYVYQLENLTLPHAKQVLDALRGRWPHVVCRLEFTFRNNLARIEEPDGELHRTVLNHALRYAVRNDLDFHDAAPRFGIDLAEGGTF